MANNNHKKDFDSFFVFLKTKKKFTTIIASFSNTKRHCSSQRREQAHFPHGKCRGTDRGEEDSLGLGTVILLPAPRAQVKARIETRSHI